MIDTVLNLLFRCRHRRMTRPFTPAPKPGNTRAGTYVVCLDCGKQFAYDPIRMQFGTDVPGSGKKRFALAVLAAVALGVVWKGRRREAAVPQAPVTVPPSATSPSNRPSP